jgi:hypothetical protein
MSDATGVDLLRGLKAIGDHIGMTERQVQHLHENGDLPTFTLGRRVCARKSVLARHFAALEAKGATDGAQ